MYMLFFIYSSFIFSLLFFHLDFGRILIKISFIMILCCSSQTDLEVNLFKVCLVFGWLCPTLTPSHFSWLCCCSLSTYPVSVIHLELSSLAFCVHNGTHLFACP